MNIEELKKMKAGLKHKPTCDFFRTGKCDCGFFDTIEAIDGLIAEAEKPVVKENLTEDAEFVKAICKRCEPTKVFADGTKHYEMFAYSDVSQLCDIIDRQAKEIEQMKRLVSRAMQTDLDNLSLIKENEKLKVQLDELIDSVRKEQNRRYDVEKENSKLKAALRKIIDRESFCNNCFEDKSIAAQALKDCNDKEA